MKEVSGKESVSRGCFKSEEHKLFMCNKGVQKMDSKENIKGLSGTVQYSVECCQEDFCNVGPFPALQDSTSKLFIYLRKGNRYMYLIGYI